MLRTPQAARTQVSFLPASESQVVTEALFAVYDHPRVSVKHNVALVATAAAQLLVYQV